MKSKVEFSVLPNPNLGQLDAIESFVKAHPDGNYFQSTLFYNACKSDPLLTPYYFTAYAESNQLVGVMLVFRQVQFSTFPLSFLSSRTIIWGGPLVFEDEPSLVEGLLQAYRKAGPTVIYTQTRNLYRQDRKWDTLRALGYAYEDHLNILIDLERTEEQLWQEVHSKRRNEIRRATREGTRFEVLQGQDGLKDCYAILKEVYKRARLPLPPLAHFESLLANSREQQGLKVFVAKFEQKIIGCMLCLAYGDTLFDYYAGAHQRYYSKYPNDLIPWEVFKWSKQNGYRKFDFGGAGKPGVPYGVRDYKKKFGGELVNFGRYEKIHYPRIYRFVTSGFKMLKALKK